jgi:hypothetical protein
MIIRWPSGVVVPDMGTATDWVRPSPLIATAHPVGV